jgi:hypothetical protein
MGRCRWSRPSQRRQRSVDWCSARHIAQRRQVARGPEVNGARWSGGWRTWPSRVETLRGRIGASPGEAVGAGHLATEIRRLSAQPDSPRQDSAGRPVRRLPVETWPAWPRPPLSSGHGLHGDCELCAHGVPLHRRSWAGKALAAGFSAWHYRCIGDAVEHSLAATATCRAIALPRFLSLAFLVIRPCGGRRRSRGSQSDRGCPRHGMPYCRRPHVRGYLRYGDPGRGRAPLAGRRARCQRDRRRRILSENRPMDSSPFRGGATPDFPRQMSGAPVPRAAFQVSAIRERLSTSTCFHQVPS